MTKPPEDPLVLQLSHGQVVAVVLQGLPLAFSPLEREFLKLLAQAAPLPVGREDLARALVVPMAMVYRLVYRLRAKLGAQGVRQVGSGTRRQGRSYGFSGYQLSLSTRLGPLEVSAV